MKYLELHQWGETVSITVQVGYYMEGNLAITLMGWEEDGPEPWNTLTVNLDGIREKDCAFVDVNNNGQEILAWILRNGLGVPTGRIGYSGYCSYPEYRFKTEKLRELDLDGYEEYSRIYKSFHSCKSVRNAKDRQNGGNGWFSHRIIPIKK